MGGVQFILWEDIFVVIDDGGGIPSDYLAIERKIIEQGVRFKEGIGCLAIIPVNARPPPQATRKAMTAAIEGAPLRCFCWFVEGSGFQAATVRAVITGLRLVSRPSYPTHVASDLEEAIRWILCALKGGDDRIESAPLAAATIRAKRAEGSAQSL
jgi:hypothetical protein